MVLNNFISEYGNAEVTLGNLESQKQVSETKLESIVTEQELVESSLQCLQKVKPLLSNSTITQCENLANAAMMSVFGMPYKVKFDAEVQAFTLDKGEFETDLAEAEGGGISTVLGFVYDVFLLLKQGKRKFMMYDEAFYAVSDQYIQNFVEFIHQCCRDLGVTVVLITHDVRISADDVDFVYQIEDGVSRKLK